MNKKCPRCFHINSNADEVCRNCHKDLTGAENSRTVDFRPVASAGAYSNFHPLSPPKSNSNSAAKTILLVILGVILVSSGLREMLKGYGPGSDDGAPDIAWREYHVPVGDLNVMMPAEPKVEEPIVTPIATGSMKKYIYHADIRDQGSAAYGVASLTPSLPINLSSSEIEKLLEQDIDRVVAKVSGTLISKKSTTVGRNPAMDFEVRLPASFGMEGAIGFGKLILIGSNEHMYFIVTKPGTRLNSEKDKFLTPIQKW